MGTFTVDDDPELALLGEDLAWPIALDGGDLATVRGEDNLLLALTTRATTGRGEVPIFPLDGVDLEDFQNGVGAADERSALEARLLEQYLREDRIDSVTVDAGDGTEVGDTDVRIVAALRSGRVLEAVVPFGGV